jgi:Cu/Ag efflux protein CusF
MKRSVVVLALAAASVLALPAVAQTSTTAVGVAPGMAKAAETVEITATITKVDAKTREVTLKGPKGREETIVAGPEVKNFAQLKVGQKVHAQYTQALVIQLHKGGGKEIGRTERAATASAEPGKTPGAAGTREVTLVGDVVALDPGTMMVTVKGKQRTVDLHVQDPEQFKLIAKGDQIEARYVEAIAIVVAPETK